MLSIVHIKWLECCTRLLLGELDDVLEGGLKLGAELLNLLLELVRALAVVAAARLRGLRVLRGRGGWLATVTTTRGSRR